MATARANRIEQLRNSIIARSKAASLDMRSPNCDWQAIRAHNAINHRTTLLRHPSVAAYWAAKR